MSGRVLVVDDVEANVKLLEAKLSSEYFDVLSAYNGRSALEIADIRTAGRHIARRDDAADGRVRGLPPAEGQPRTADVPVVMVTALSDVANRLRGLEAGADDFLTKPVNDIALFARVRSFVRLKRMMEELRGSAKSICGRFAATTIARRRGCRPCKDPDRRGGPLCCGAEWPKRWRRWPIR